jgi:DsbC/DsbD-like thiol-disulfide interchange protein
MKAITLALVLLPLLGQELGLYGNGAGRKRQYVSYAAEPQTIAAGKRAVVALHFRVNEGFHVNSHTPKSDLLIPTRMELTPERGVKASEAMFPAGTTFSFDFDPKEKLDVYQGPFTVELPVVATAGAHEMTGVLTYQACDRSACYPPRDLAVVVDFVAR